jgi:signal transduction histidine kinase
MDSFAARERLYRRFVAEEVAAGLRHTLVNKLAGLGALVYHLKRQLPAGETLAAMITVVPMLEDQVAQAAAALDLRLLPTLVPRPEAVPLAAALGETVRTWAPRAPGVELVGPAHGPAAALIDAGELDLAVTCLLENACEALAGPGGLVQVRCLVVPGDGSEPLVAVEVADDGPGLSPEARRQAREPFYTTKPGRLGLGLNVAARVAQRCRGRLQLEAVRARDGRGPRGRRVFAGSGP